MTLHMIDEICGHIHNYFPDACHPGTYDIEDGVLTAPFLAEGDCYCIRGSRFNDGAHRYTADQSDLADETFTGEVWTMKLPAAFLRLVGEIEAWQAKYGARALSPFQSENVIGVYSYQKASGGEDAGGLWESVFKRRLNRWRKLS